MSTPTPSGALAQKQPPLTAHNATTPSSFSHLPVFSSPAPRSVPSPAAHRTQAGKSPFNISTQPPSSSAMAAVNHPTGSSAGGAAKLLGSSPAAAMLDFNSPATLGLSLGNLGGMEGGVGMGISMSGLSALGLGLGTSMGGRNNDEEQRRRLEAVIATIGTRFGRVSEEGVERLSLRCGFDVLWEDFVSRQERARMRRLSIGGKTVVVDVDFRSNAVQQVALTFHGASENDNTHTESASKVLQDNLNSHPDSAAKNLHDNLKSHAKSAARVLEDNLTPPPGIAGINLMLDKFAKNLESLARLDKLSSPELNCFEAITGVYMSLRRLFEHERRAAMALMDVTRPDSDERAEREVLCKRSGRPCMDVNERIGLSLEYWMERRHVLRKKGKPRQPPADPDDDKHMDVDKPPGDNVYETNKTFSLSLECESCPAELYPSIRASDAWISELIEKPSDDPTDLFGTNVIDWLEPPPSYISSANPQPNALGLEDGTTLSKLPDVRFVAKLNPPLVVPLQVAVQILASVGVTIPQETIKATTFESLVLRPESQSSEAAIVGVTADSMKEVKSLREVLVVGGDGHEEVGTHANALLVPKVEYGRVLDEIPFAHPRQIIQLLPTLRQYAFLTSLLQTTFSPPNPPAPISNRTPKVNGAHPSKPPAPSNPDPAPASAPLPIDISLTATTPPRLTFVFPPLLPSPANHPASPSCKPPHLDVPTNGSTLPPEEDDPDLDTFLSPVPPPSPNQNTTASATPPAPLTVALAVLPNAEVAVVGQNVIDHDVSGGGGGVGGPEQATADAQGADLVEGVSEEMERERRKVAAVQRVGRALEVCGDVGVWVEWVRRSVVGGGEREV